METQKKSNILLMLGAGLLLATTMTDLFYEIPLSIYLPLVVLGMALVIWYIRIIRFLKKAGKIQVKADQIRKNFIVMIVAMIIGSILGVAILLYMLADYSQHIIVIVISGCVLFDIMFVLYLIRMKNKHIKDALVQQNEPENPVPE